MRSVLFSGLVAWMFLAVAKALDASVPLPSDDPFYLNPSNIGDYKPGQVIDQRAVSNHLNGYSSSVSVTVQSSHQVKYRTTDSLGQPVAAVMTIMVPFNPDPSKFIAHQFAYDAVNLNCVPSYALRSGANTTAAADLVFAAAALNNGWIVVASDFQGIYGQFAAGIQSGHAALDSVRAALSAGPQYGLSPSAKYVMYGYSGGAIGVEWAIELQPTYAPELNFAGAALGGLSPNVATDLAYTNKGASAGLGIAGIQGLAKAYPNLTEYVDEHLIASKKAEWLSVGNGCLSQITSAGVGMDIWSYFDNGDKFLTDDVPASVLQIAGLAGRHGTPKMPLFVYEAVADEIAPVATVDALVQQFCNSGAVIQYQRNYYGEHVINAITVGPTAFLWLSDRLAGKPLQYKTCVTQQVFVSEINPALAPVLGTVAMSALESIFSGGDLGRWPTISG